MAVITQWYRRGSNPDRNDMSPESRTELSYYPVAYVKSYIASIFYTITFYLKGIIGISRHYLFNIVTANIIMLISRS